MRDLLRRLIGRRTQSQIIDVILWGKPDCSLCDKAQAILDRLGRDLPLKVDKRDITADAAAYDRYRFVIPVVEIVGGPRFEGKISEHRLRQALEAMSGRSSTGPRYHSQVRPRRPEQRADQGSQRQAN